MDQLESELRAALRRKPTPVGFGERLRRRLPGGVAAPTARCPRRVRWHVWAAAAAVALTLGVGLVEHQRRVRSRNRAALEQTLTALSIAAEQLERAESRAFSGWERLGAGLSEVSNATQSMHSSGPARSTEPRSRTQQ